MEDIIKSVKAFLYDRSSSPLFGSFLTSWVVINFKLFLIIFSDIKPQEKITEISKIYSSLELLPISNISLQTSYVDGFILPLIACMFYLYIYPLIAKPVYKHALVKQSEINALKKQHESNRLLTLEESRIINIKILEIESERDKEISKYETEINNLKETIKNLNEKQSLINNGNINKEEPQDDETAEKLYNVFIGELSEISAGTYDEEDIFEMTSLSNIPNGIRRRLINKFNSDINKSKFESITKMIDPETRQVLYHVAVPAK